MTCVSRRHGRDPPRSPVVPFVSPCALDSRKDQQDGQYLSLEVDGSKEDGSRSMKEPSSVGTKIHVGFNLKARQLDGQATLDAASAPSPRTSQFIMLAAVKRSPSIIHALLFRTTAL